MKKILSLLLAVLTVFSLCACSSNTNQTATPGEQATTAPAENPMQMGFGRACITPEDSVPLNGYGTSTNRMSTEVLDDLFVTCIAFKSDSKVALLFSQDLYHSTAVLTPTLRSEISSAVKVPAANIFIAATGTYSGPDTKSEHENAKKFIEKYKAGLIEAAQTAMDDLAPTTLSCGTTEVEGLSFVHHYTMIDGTVEDGYYGFFDREITGHAAEADRTMRLVKAEREGKPAILLVNWQCRPTLTGGNDKTVISADFVGYMRNKVEADTGMLCAYFTGAFGDLSPNSLIESEKHNLTVSEYGETLASYAVDALDTLEPLTGSTTIGTYTANYGCLTHREETDRLEDAKKVTSQRKKLGDLKADKLAKELGFRSVFHAAAISGRTTRKEKDSFEISTLRFGELGFLMSATPLFCSIGEEGLAKSPVGFSFMLCQANAAWQCIPSAAAFDYGGYEADVSYWARGSGEKMMTLLNEMLLMTTDD